VVFGATGYTGRLVVAELVRCGLRPVVAGRSADRVRALAEEHGGLPTATADVSRPGTVRALIEHGDVLISTVGPFVRYGQPALDAAIDAGAHYLDSCGEPGFYRQVFTQAAPRARAAGSALLTGCGFDFVPGHLAGALAVRETDGAARRLDVGYFFTEGSRLSSGTRATARTGSATHSATVRWYWRRWAGSRVLSRTGPAAGPPSPTAVPNRSPCPGSRRN
jgi:short subunit dehydrogenase-like uncharacterized protein